nr:hypothetical protein [Kibdelosporangium sp. MJ126-NF4]CEL13555.1 hypothetical protein [Kibdelosporangium sp. MJ126-NF4]CTQ99241.1 hypothetical protein [Kibdelosporangium sp. MJ126-NF4]
MVIERDTATSAHEAAVADALIATLTTQLVSAVHVDGIEHQEVDAILNARFPTVTHHRQSLVWGVDEHVFVDRSAGVGVRMLTRRDDRTRRVQVHVAEVGGIGLWDKIVAYFAEWELAGRPVPESLRIWPAACPDWRP